VLNFLKVPDATEENEEYDYAATKEQNTIVITSCLLLLAISLRIR
jgi:hypothetical protein